MSEIRITTTINEIHAAPLVPLMSLSEAISSNETEIVRGMTSLNHSASVAGLSSGQEKITMPVGINGMRVRQLSISDIHQILASASSARNAIAALGEGLEVPRVEASRLALGFNKLALHNDKAGVGALAETLIAERQNRLVKQILPIVAQSCQAIGFTPANMSAPLGLIAAQREGTRQQLAIEVAKTKEGGVQIHFDAQGFTGGACVQTLDALEKELRARGVHCNLQDRCSKQSRPVIDRTRIGQRLRIFRAN